MRREGGGAREGGGGRKGWEGGKGGEGGGGREGGKDGREGEGGRNVHLFIKFRLHRVCPMFAVTRLWCGTWSV